MAGRSGRIRNRIIISFVLVILVCAMIPLAVCAAGKDMTNPQNAVKTVVEAYINGNSLMLRQCYAQNAFLSDEVDFETRFYEAVAPVDYEISGTETLWTSNNYSYVGISVMFTVGEDEVLPYYAYFLTKKINEDEYRIVIGEETPSWAEEKITNENVKYKQTALYLSTMDKVTTTDKTEEYLDGVYTRVMTPVLGMTDSMRINVEYLGITFGVMIVELGAVLIWVIWITRSRKKRHNIVSKTREELEASFRRTIHNFEPDKDMFKQKPVKS